MPRLALLILLPLALPAWSAKVSIQGVHSMSESEAIDLISARLEYIEKRKASPSRADDAAFLLDRLLIQRGFTNPKVEWSLPGGNRILLTVVEGPRSTLGEVHIKGLDGELHDALKAQINSAHKARTFAIGEATPFLLEHNQEALRDARNLLRSKGFWDAKVRLAQSTRNPRTTAVDLYVEAVRGPLYHLLPIQFEGSAHPDLIARLAKFGGQEATAQNIRNIRARAEQFYRKRGHQFAKVHMLAEHRAGKTQLRFQIDPGPRFRVGEIHVVGAQKVKPHLVKSRFRKFPGENYDSDAFNEEVRDLLGTGAFAGIRVKENPRPDGFIDLILNVTESKPEGYYFYGGAGSFEGLIIGAGYYNRNLLGNLWNLSTRAEWSGLGLLGEVSVTEPQFLGYDLRLTPSAFLTTRTYEGYKKAEAGFNVELEWDVFEHYAIKGSFQNSLVTLSTDGLPRAELGPDGYFLHVLGLSHTYDRRDNQVLPKDGFYAQLTTDLGLALGTESVSFLRGEGQVSYYKTIFDKGAVALGGRAGVIIPSASAADLPIDLRYFLGGGNTVRSFPERELGPEAANGLPRGGQSYWVANAEYIHSIVGPVNGVLFLDAGSLHRGHNAVITGDIKYAVGLGIRLDLPIGPVRIEYGYALNPENNEPAGALHFAIGSAF
ncbi:MAG: BamA/TamA family outer membrane protein [Roseibacillus sp.]